MFIKEISITNFRGIRKGSLSDLSQVNLLIGRNNTGKSTILDAFYLIGYSITSNDPLGRNRRSYIIERKASREADERWFHYNFDRSQQITISLIFPDGTQFSYSEKEGRPSVSAAEVARTLLGQVLLVDPELLRRFHLLEGTLWRQIQSRRSDREIKDILNEAYELAIEYITFLQPRSELAFALPTTTIPVDSMGDGVRNALAMLSAAISLRDTVLLIEEIEMHQHPESLRALFKALLELAKRHQLQLFITTHSLEAINYALETAEKAELDLKVYHLTLSQDGVLSSRGIPAFDAKLLADIGPDLRMLYKYTAP